jgi:DNA-binding beta-propeller fold protein YncE
VCSSEEVCFASQCQILGTTCDWDPANFTIPIPIHESNYYADVAFDANCDLLVAGAFSPTVFRVSRTTGAVTTAYDIPDTANMLSVAVRPTDGTVFVVTDGPPVLWSIGANGVAVQVMPLPTTVAALAFAPPMFGAYGSKLFGSGSDGNLYVFEPQQPSMTSIAQVQGIASDLAFAPDGSAVYLAVDAGRIDKVTPMGAVSTFASGLWSPDGLAVSADGTRLYVAEYSDGIGLLAYPLPSGAPVVGPRIQFDGGWYTTGVVVDRSGDILVKAKDAILEGAALHVVPKF